MRSSRPGPPGLRNWASRGFRRRSWAAGRPGVATPRLPLPDGEIIGALTGLWPPRKSEISAADARSAAKDSIRAIQMVRAYRVIGHLEADLDPLG